MNRAVFFDHIRKKPFDGSLSQSQVNGINVILDEWDRRGWSDLRWLAYILATAKWETAHTMQPIKEMGGPAYLMSKAYWPWIGRGFVQLTWEFNYLKFQDRVKRIFDVDIIRNPDAAMLPDVAAYIMFEGMANGEFASHNGAPALLKRYFNDSVSDPAGARRIVNGTDKRIEIAKIYDAFYGALTAAAQASVTVPPAPRPQPAKTFWERLMGWAW